MTRRVAVLTTLVVVLTVAIVWMIVTSGLRFFMVSSPSMGVTAPVGTLVVSRPSPDYQVEDIVSFDRDDRTYTHRIIAANPDGSFVTRGDLNNVADPLPVLPSQIIGKAVWLAPGLGWLWRGLPLLIIGALIVVGVSRLRRLDHPWQWVLRISGWTLVFCLVAMWLRPWVGVAMLGSTPAAGAGVDMHVVNTGLFPLDVLGERLVSGQDATIRVTQLNDRGEYTITPGLAFHWWEQVGLFLICLIPMALSFLIREKDEPTRALVEADGEKREDRKSGPTSAAPSSSGAQPNRGRLILIGSILLAVIAAVAVVTFSTTQSALTASVTNNTNTAGTRTFFTCTQAVSSSARPVPYLAWAASAAANTTSAGSPSTQIDLSGNSRTGRYSSNTGRTSITADTSTYACGRDTVKASVSFTGSTGGFCLFQQGGYSSTNTPQTFSIEAWFKTDRWGTGQGKIIGFGDSRTNASDGDHDRHIYLDKDGRLVFGVYPGAVKIVYSPAGKNYADSAWHHVVGTLASSGASQGLRLYVDGKLVDSDATVTTAQDFDGYWKAGCGSLTAWQNAATAEAGNTSNYDFTASKYFTGQLQFISVYSVALTAAQVKEHYLAGAD
jgi:signal peptidase I